MLGALSFPDLYRSLMTLYYILMRDLKGNEAMIGRYLSLLPDLTSKMCTIPVYDTVAKYFPSILNAA